jgi:hypothetical protein
VDQQAEMTPSPPADPTRPPDDSADFSLVLGGPLYQLFLRSGLTRPPLDLLRRRVVALPVLTWLPLLVLSAVQGQALAGVGLPFLQDLEAQARFLLALPLLVVAEVVVHQRLAPGVRLFIEKGIVRAEDRSRFDSIIASTMRLRNSVAVEVVLIAFVLTAGHYLWQEQLAIRADTWYAIQTPQGLALSPAGRCYAWFSLPVFQFILIRWYYRILLWGRFLWRVSRLDLHLAPAHPDRAGGLGFLGVSTYAFVPLLLGQSVIVSAMIAGRILHEGAQLQAFKYEIAGALVLALLQALGPLLVFLPGLLAAKRRGLREYGLLADRYVREFERKWLHGGAAPDEALVGTSDIQSLADLQNSFAVVSEMRAAPFGKQTILQLLVVAALPMLPLALTMFPLDELIRRVLGVLL